LFFPSFYGRRALVIVVGFGKREIFLLIWLDLPLSISLPSIPISREFPLLLEREMEIYPSTNLLVLLPLVVFLSLL